MRSFFSRKFFGRLVTNTRSHVAHLPMYLLPGGKRLLAGWSLSAWDKPVMPACDIYDEDRIEVFVTIWYLVWPTVIKCDQIIQCSFEVKKPEAKRVSQWGWGGGGVGLLFAWVHMDEGEGAGAPVTRRRERTGRLLRRVRLLKNHLECRMILVGSNGQPLTSLLKPN